VSGRLRLRRGVVVDESPLTVEIDGERRPAWADRAELGLGSGGFDVVHVNLTRGLEPGRSAADRGRGDEPHVIKLNYSSLQHAVHPIEDTDDPVRRLSPPMGAEVAATRVLVLPLHGHLAPAAWALAQARDEGGQALTGDGGRAPTAGYVQTGGGALPGSMSRDVAELRERGLLAGHIAAAPAYGGEQEERPA
jgi:hypothetical protein